MKLLLDQNLSPILVAKLEASYPGSAHVREFGLERALDEEIWDFARARGFAIVSKDGDFHQMSFLLGAPPKVIWLRVGNCSTDEILTQLERQNQRILAFDGDGEAGLLVLP